MEADERITPAHRHRRTFRILRRDGAHPSGGPALCGEEHERRIAAHARRVADDVANGRDNPAPAAPDAEAEADPARKLRLPLARLLRRAGSLSAEALAGLSGGKPSLVRQCLGKCQWFVLNRRRGVWRLTLAGERAVRLASVPPRERKVGS